MKLRVRRRDVELMYSCMDLNTTVQTEVSSVFFPFPNVAPAVLRCGNSLVFGTYHISNVDMTETSVPGLLQASQCINKLEKLGRTYALSALRFLHTGVCDLSTEVTATSKIFNVCARPPLRHKAPRGSPVRWLSVQHFVCGKLCKGLETEVSGQLDELTAQQVLDNGGRLRFAVWSH